VVSVDLDEPLSNPESEKTMAADERAQPAEEVSLICSQTIGASVTDGRRDADQASRRP
jgi:hypothetical protein